MSVILKLF